MSKETVDVVLVGAGIMSTTLGTGPLAGRGVDLIVYGIIIIVIAAFRPTGLLSLPWGRWLRVGGPAATGPDAARDAAPGA